MNIESRKTDSKTFRFKEHKVGIDVGMIAFTGAGNEYLMMEVEIDDRTYQFRFDPQDMKKLHTEMKRFNYLDKQEKVG